MIFFCFEIVLIYCVKSTCSETSDILFYSWEGALYRCSNLSQTRGINRATTEVHPMSINYPRDLEKLTDIGGLAPLERGFRGLPLGS